MIVVAGTLRLESAALERLRPLALETVEATRAEDGCLVYAFSEDLLEPGLVRIYEEWTSMAALDAHGRTEHIARWREALAGESVLAKSLKTIEAGAIRPLD